MKNIPLMPVMHDRLWNVASNFDITQTYTRGDLLASVAILEGIAGNIIENNNHDPDTIKYLKHELNKSIYQLVLTYTDIDLFDVIDLRESINRHREGAINE